MYQLTVIASPDTDRDVAISSQRSLVQIYLSHASASNYETELYEPLTVGLPKHQLILPHSPGLIDTKTFELLRGADLVIAEVSQPSTGQGIELGWADGMGIPIVALHRAGATPSSAISLVAKKVASYKDVRDLAPTARVLVAPLE